MELASGLAEAKYIGKIRGAPETSLDCHLKWQGYLQKTNLTGHPDPAGLVIPSSLNDMVGFRNNGYRIPQSPMEPLKKYQIVDH